MPIVEYPFIADTSWQPTWRPYLPIEFVNPNNGCGVLTFAPIDSGALHCYIPFEWAREMDITLEESDRIDVYCADVKREGYKYELGMRIFGIVPVYRDNVFVPENIILGLPEIEVVFLRELKNPRLGVNGFLATYVLILNNRIKKFSIRIPREDRPCTICRPAQESSLFDLIIEAPFPDTP